MGKNRNLAFIVELLLLFVILLFVIVTITRTFMASRSQSLYAKHLTEAVCIAEEVAEITAAAPDQESAVSFLKELDEVHSVTENDTGFSVEMDALSDGKADRYTVSVLCSEEKTAGEPSAESTGSFSGESGGQDKTGVFVTEKIEVFFETEAEPIYTLDTGNYKKAD